MGRRDKMLGNQEHTGMQTDQQFIEGTPVFDINGDKVGTVSEHNVQGRYVILHKGWLFPQDLYVPLDAVQRADVDGVYLSLDKDEIGQRDWTTPPPADDRTARTVDTTSMDQAGRASMTTNTENAAATDIRVPVREEELVAGTRAVEAGRVHLHKEVVEEQKTITVPVQREEVYMERVPVSGESATVDARDAFVERDIEVPVMGEEVIAEKRAHVVEEVRLHKDVVTETQQVADTVRKERVTVEDVADDTPDLRNDQMSSRRYDAGTNR